ncbi:hypothetical protein M0R45_009427 [Rubus argutus]|uniref:Uncharacterized protein n=1 Tax=Rubus argutus TaxID=59490 RepID=A0AAW1Y3L6_RUBAR
MGNARGTKEAWETVDENTQVEILKEARLVDDDKAENLVCVLMGQQNKVQPLGEFKNRKCVDVDKTTRGKSLDSGFVVLDQKNREKRSYSDGRLRVMDWAFGNFSKNGGPAEHKGIQSGPKDKKDDPNFFVNGPNGYEEEFKELVGMCSTIDFLEETRLENEDFAEFASALNENSQESSDSEEYVPDSSSDDEEVVSVLDQHEGILKDFFQEKDAQVDLKAQGQQDKEDFSGSIKTLKKVKIKDATAHKCSKNFASTSEGKSMERMGRFMSKLKIATFPLKKS